MKRFLCSKHIHHLKTEGKSVLLSTEKCSICRWEKRPENLKDIARSLEDIALDFRAAHEDPYWDPHGITILWPFAEIVNRFLKSIHVSYRKPFIESITKNLELEFNKIVFESTYDANPDRPT